MVILEKLRLAWPVERWRDVTVLVAVSGGADSVALLRALATLREAGAGRLIVGHFNHRLRGDESDGDQQFVEQLAKSLGLPLGVGGAHPNLSEQSGGMGLEAAARQARYEFLTSAAATHGARYIATAHTADDQVETVLHNVLRGTGLTGLAGIPRTRRLSEGATLIRPLLEVTRAEILDYLRELQQPYREDSTNIQVEFTRNRIRHELLPLLERDYYPGTRQALLRLTRIASQTNDFLDAECQKLLPKSVRSAANGVEINCAALQAVHAAVLRQLFAAIWQQQGWPLQDMTLEKWEQLDHLAQRADTTTTFHLPGAVLATRAGDYLRLVRHG